MSDDQWCLCLCFFYFIICYRRRSYYYYKSPILKLILSSPKIRSAPDYIILYRSRALNFLSLGSYFVIWRSYALQSGYESLEEEDEEGLFLRGLVGLAYFISSALSYFLYLGLYYLFYSLPFSFSFSLTFSASLRIILFSLAYTFVTFFYFDSSSFAFPFYASFLGIGAGTEVAVDTERGFSGCLSGFPKGFIILGKYSFFFVESDEGTDFFIF